MYGYKTVFGRVKKKFVRGFHSLVQPLTNELKVKTMCIWSLSLFYQNKHTRKIMDVCFFLLKGFIHSKYITMMYGYYLLKAFSEDVR